MPDCGRARACMDVRNAAWLPSRFQNVNVTRMLQAGFRHRRDATNDFARSRFVRIDRSGCRSRRDEPDSRRRAQHRRLDCRGGYHRG